MIRQRTLLCLETVVSMQTLIMKSCPEEKMFSKVDGIVDGTCFTVQEIINNYRYKGIARNKRGRGRKKLLLKRSRIFNFFLIKHSIKQIDIFFPLLNRVISN